MFLLPFYEDLRYIFIVSQVEVHEGDAQNLRSKFKKRTARNANAAGIIRSRRRIV
jgi:hypothetical protein